MLPLGVLRLCPDQGRQAAHRPVGTYQATGQARSLCKLSAWQGHNELVSREMPCTGISPVRAICTIPDTPPAWPPRRGCFDIGRNEGPSLPDSRRKTGSLAPSFLPDSRVRSRRGCGMVSPETVKCVNVLCPEDCLAPPAPPPQRFGYRCKIRN